MIRVVVADDGEITAEVVEVALDGQAGAVRFIAQPAAKLVEVGTALTAGTLGIILTSDLGAVFSLGVGPRSMQSRMGTPFSCWNGLRKERT